MVNEWFKTSAGMLSGTRCLVSNNHFIKLHVSKLRVWWSVDRNVHHRSRPFPHCWCKFTVEELVSAVCSLFDWVKNLVIPGRPWRCFGETDLVSWSDLFPLSRRLCGYCSQSTCLPFPWHDCWPSLWSLVENTLWQMPTQLQIRPSCLSWGPRPCAS